MASTLALAAHGDKASAQAFQLNDANPSVQAGSVDFSRNTTPTPGAETITINTPTAIINWNRAETDFLPAGTVATFQNGSGVTNFAVLNRITSLTGGPVRFDGTVLSRVNGNPGGTVIFQNTGGIIVGSTAVFDVGNLVLTSLFVNDETGYGDFLNSGGGLNFVGANPPYDQAIVVEAGAQINALAEGSYVVLAAPRIIQGGNVYVNGNVAYVAGENATFTVNAGAFDIVLQNGSDGNPNPIIHTGSTGGPASTGSGDQHSIFMLTAAYFQNQAVTMLLSGSIGFDEAVSATVENGEIILSSGFASNFSEGKYAEGNIEITGGTFTSDVFARATRNVIATSEDGPLSFTGDLTVVAYEQALLGAVNGAVTVGGDVSLTALGPLDFESGYGGGISSNFSDGGFVPFGVNAEGGIAEITAENGEMVTIAGNATLNASAVGGFESVDDFEAGDGFGGVVRVATTGNGTVAIGGDLTMTATGEGAVTDYVPDLGGNGFGGDAIVSAQSGSITVGGGLFVDVSGTGSRSNGLETGQGAGGSGGTVSISAFGGSVSFAGAGQIVARGAGGAIEEPDGPAVAGAGRGGNLFIDAGNGSMALGSSMTVDLSGQGGDGPVGGEGSGGGVFASAGAGQIDLGAISVSVQGFGGTGTEGVGGAGSGGNVTLASFSSSGSLVAADAIEILATGQGGNGTGGGEGRGGFIRFSAEGDGELQFGDTSVVADGLGGNGTNAGGSGFGGQILVGVEVGYGGSATASFGNTTLGASGRGGDGGVSGGAGTGGSVQMNARAGQLSFANVTAGAVGYGGIGGSGAGGAGTGGVVQMSATQGGELSFAGAALVSEGVGGAGATGGAGSGGPANSPGAIINAADGTVTGTSAALVTRGVGGNASGTGTGGAATAGQAQIVAANGATGGVINIGSVSINASATGGASTGGTGGTATGNNLAVAAQTLNGSITIGSLNVNGQARGGDGVTGGNAIAGFATVGTISGNETGPPATGSGTYGAMVVNMSGFGGAGTSGAGGNGTGGRAVLLGRGSTLQTGNVTLTSVGGGGASASGAGGEGAGGETVIELSPRNQSGEPVNATLGAVFLNNFGAGGVGTTVGASRHGLAAIRVLGGTANFASIAINVGGADAPTNSLLDGPTSIVVSNSQVNVAGNLGITSARDIEIVSSSGTLTAASANIASATGPIRVSADGSGGLAGGAWTLDTPGDISVTHANRPGSSNTINVASLTALGNNFTAGAGSVIRASGNIGINVANLATIAGTVVSPDIFIASSDIDIAGTGFLGDAGTTEITLSVNPQSAQTVIGGTADTAGYTLTQAEIGRIRTASLEIEASPTSSAPSRPADLVIRDLTLSVTPNPAGAAVNRLQISVNAGEGAGGIVQVEGAVRVENATSSSGIDIIAGERIQIINPAGSLRVLASGGLPSGSIGMQSANIWSASQAIIDQLVQNPNFEGRNDALLANSGDVQERGYIEAGDILLRVGSTLFVQNSGTADRFAGITVTQNTLTVEPTSSGQIDVYAFGRRINADGTFVINTPYFREVAFGSGSGYIADAQFNTCFIASGQCGFGPEQPVPAGPEIIEGPIDEVEETTPPPNPDRQQFVDVSFASESLLEEPVTSGGDSGVWDEEGRDCEPGDEVCEQRDGGGQ